MYSFREYGVQRIACANSFGLSRYPVSGLRQGQRCPPRRGGFSADCGLCREPAAADAGMLAGALRIRGVALAARRERRL